MVGSNNMLPLGGGRISNLGTKISYDPTWSDPLNVKRKADNISFTVVYYLFVCLWVGVAVYVIFRSTLVTGDAEKYSDFYRDSKDLIFKEGWIIAIVLPLAAFLSILCLLLLRVAARPVVYTMIALFFIALFAIVIYSGFSLADEQSYGRIILFTLSLVLLILFFFLFIIKYKFIPMICEIIREASKAMLTFPDDDYPAHLVLCHFVNAVALVWIICHVYGFFKVSVSGAYGTWYWSMNKKEVPKFTTLRFIYIAFRYHIGPTAFGSLIITVCTILQILLAYVETSGVDGTLGTDLCSCGLDCCDTALYILKAVIEAVTGMAYVHIGNHGTGFIDAARVSFTLFKRNYAKIAVIAQIATDTIFMCVLEDYEMNGGSSRPFHMSNKLKDLVLENRLE
ncbi:hypothetical protein TKK_0001212 [Trichogramma kaykai]